MDSAPTSYDDYARGIRVERTLAYLESIPDPYQRIRECGVASDQARTIQSKIAAIRRQAVYEATLKPGSSGESVAVELGVSAKAVSTAIGEFRKADLQLFREALSLYGNGASTTVPEAELRAAAGTRDVLFAARTVLRAHAARDLSSELDTLFEPLENAAHRARVLASTGQVEYPKSAWEHLPIGQLQPDIDGMPPEHRRLGHVLNALPQVLVSIWGAEDEDDWYVSWHIRPAEPYSTVFDAGPHRDGWATTEWLVWLLRDYQRAGYDIDQYVTSPPPFLNEPGESLSFVVRFGRRGDGKSVDSIELADYVMSTWATTGYQEVDWPEAVR